MELDRARATPIYGGSVARWCQDGRYFTGDGRPLTADEAGAQNPADIEPPPPPEPTELPSYNVVQAPRDGRMGIITGGDHLADAVVPRAELVERVASLAARDEERRMALSALRSVDIFAAVKAAGGRPATGPHSRTRNINWLLGHTQ